MSRTPSFAGLIIPPWQAAPQTLQLSEGDAHVWRLSLASPPDAVSIQTLSADELEKAESFRFDRDRRRYVACRSTLRRLLARYTHVAPGQLTFSYNAHGKPFLAQCPIRFNVSHSHDLALIAVAVSAEIGVDTELADTSGDHQALARRFFTAAEQNFLQNALPAHRAVAFCQVWTRKEAWMKALGHGLMRPPEEFDVSASLDRPVATLRSPEGEWTVVELRAPPHCPAALVASTPLCSLSLFDARFDPPATGT